MPELSPIFQSTRPPNSTIICTASRRNDWRHQRHAHRFSLSSPYLLFKSLRNVNMGAQAVHSQVVWFDIPCVDLDRAIRFYEAVLDCKIARHTSPGFDLGVLPHEGTAI